MNAMTCGNCSLKTFHHETKPITVNGITIPARKAYTCPTRIGYVYRDSRNCNKHTPLDDEDDEDDS